MIFFSILSYKRHCKQLCPGGKKGFSEQDLVRIGSFRAENQFSNDTKYGLDKFYGSYAYLII